MARSKSTRRPSLKVLREELDDALGALFEVRSDGTAKASVAHATAMVRVWSLRFQIGNADRDNATDDIERINADKAMRDASTALEAWEKRKSVALDDVINDLLLDEQEHNEEQDALAAEAETLA